eukprot:2336872-Rhodomonas_salina.1
MMMMEAHGCDEPEERDRKRGRDLEGKRFGWDRGEGRVCWTCKKKEVKLDERGKGASAAARREVTWA